MIKDHEQWEREHPEEVAAQKQRRINEEAAEKAEHDKFHRAQMITALGGKRAADEYREDNFVAGVVTAPALAAASGFVAATENLYLHGPTGSGKSHLAAIAARRSFQTLRRYNCVRTVTPMVVSRSLRSCSDADHEAYVLQELVDSPVLVLEDFGVEKGTEFLLSALYEVVNGRYQNGVGGLIVTSNLSLGELAAKLGDDRMPSRLSQMCKVFDLRGAKDYRVPEKKS